MKYVILFLSVLLVSCSTKYIPIHARHESTCERADNEIYLINHKVLTYKFECKELK